MNNVTLVGRLTANPKKTVTQSGATIVRFNLAVNRQFKNDQGEYETDFINCIVFGKTAETTNEYCKKGDLVAVKGRIQTGSYTAQDGSKRYTTEVVAERLSFLQTKKKEDTKEQVQEQQTSDPFGDFGEQVSIDDNFLE